MASTCVVGLQWGDEAKGKIVDLLTGDHHIVVRYNGGANAGHTIVKDGKTYKLSLLPTGILSPHMQAVIGNGVVVNPVRFLEEVENLRDAGIAVGDNLVLSDHAHLIFPYHVEEERARLRRRRSAPPAAASGRAIRTRSSRVNGIRVGELLHPEHLRERLRSIVPRKNQMLAVALGQRQAIRCRCPVRRISRLRGSDAAAHQGHRASVARCPQDKASGLLFEAAQGSLLDVDHGTYPYVTSSNSSDHRHLDRLAAFPPST